MFFLPQYTTVYHKHLGTGRILSHTFRGKDVIYGICFKDKGMDFITHSNLLEGNSAMSLQPIARDTDDSIPDSVKDVLERIIFGGGQ